MTQHGPIVRIWAPNPQVDPVAYSRMNKPGANLSWLEHLLAEHGVAEIDFVPPFSRTTLEDTHFHYELHSSSELDGFSAALRKIRTAIHEELGLAGALYQALTERKRQHLETQLKLTVKWAANAIEFRAEKL